jgi:hypothetical protein
VAPIRNVLIGAAALALLLIGMHNTWDTVTHIVVVRLHDDATKT